MWMFLGGSENLEKVVKDSVQMTGVNDWEANLGGHKRNSLFLLVCFWHNELENNYCSIGNSVI